MTPIQTNKPLFFNLDGEPLNGKIYIGQPSADPRTSPKTVTLRDSGGSEFTAAQPLTTINGRITYNGKPIVALVDGEYSILIFDSAGAQVDYTPSITPDGGSAGSVDFSSVTRVGLTLNEIKSFDAAVGEVVRNVGGSSATDGEEGEWLVKSATGASGDDLFLIDLDNGLQAERVNITGSYPKLVWSGSSTSVSMVLLASQGSGLYLVEADGAMGLVAVSTSGINFNRGLLDLDIGSGFLSVKAVRYSGASNAFTAVSNAIIDVTGTPETQELDLTITRIFKV